MRILIQKARRQLMLLDAEGIILFSCKIALGSAPAGPKEKEGDGKTPEGEYYICLKKIGKYGPSLGISYPNEQDAIRMQMDADLIACIRERARNMERPPWGSPMGGEIYIHGGGTVRDWTAGCIALSDQDAEKLYELVPLGTRVAIGK